MDVDTIDELGTSEEDARKLLQDLTATVLTGASRRRPWSSAGRHRNWRIF